MDRGPQHPNRDALRWGGRRPHTGSRSRTGGARARRTRWPRDARYPSAAAGDQFHSHRDGTGQRSRRSRLRFELGASGREHHGLRARRFPNGGEVAGDAQRGRPRRFSRRTHVQPGHVPPLLRLPAFVRGHATSIAADVTAAPVRDTTEVEEAFAKLGREPGGGLIVPPDAFTTVHQHLLIRLAQQHRVPAVYGFRAYVAQGALISYGPEPYDLFRRSASYVDRILKGAKPADLPVQQPTKFELAINLKTAKALGLQIPDRLLALADEVIE